MTAGSPVTRGRLLGSRCALLTGAAGAAATMLALACSQDGEPASTRTVRDSSGVRIVENRNFDVNMSTNQDPARGHQRLRHEG